MIYIGKDSYVILGSHHKGGLYYIDIPVDVMYHKAYN